MASQSQGIQQLLAAEKKAAELVSDARKRKTKRLKEAKEEAQAEIELFRREREKAFEEYQKTHMGSKDEFVLQDEQDTRAKLEEIERNVQTNKDAMIERILSLVYEIKPELHQNVRL
ncbi:V-type proton ATPase subunit G-like [Xenia sp. Carnegie-2017]|uniref:V-type proton ATPase subunit G-like n=1 Tax=Xenia sp. Carnegie-2017 TaxID=2897299 RepID=UPI001F03A460|nr:V-type proton ATPase subunit G-like [Xenia sp. Carnegie-2017]